MNRKLAAAAVAALTAFCSSPAYADEIRNKQWHLTFLQVSEAHLISTGKGVTVAVIDSGVAQHPDLDGSILSGTDLIKSGNGRTDLTGHGSSMAGLIAAHGEDDQGALGIAPDAKVIPIRVLGSGRTNVPFGKAVRFALNHGAKVINISIGGGVQPDDFAVFKEAATADAVVVASAGNRPESVAISAPAFLDSVVAVGAVDRSGRRAAISVTGQALDLSAPGEDITSTNNKGGYIVGQKGTSDAAAIVSGAAALLRSKYPGMTAEEVVQRLKDTATDKGAPGVDEEYGHGIVNIVAALRAGDASAPEPQGSSGRTGLPSPTRTSTHTEPDSSSTPFITGAAIAVLVMGSAAVAWVRRKSSGGAR
ncbi:S8 family serine peptidase [Couchioplanes azureus]|uniref:S8 family serine peptidase n=1 Tax=Couchioplanes caeruleus TaxID=56438 RepID=UPI0016711484|nr:S8 family serine peptidase [Couchioplanes caeruleus]GGQ41233.1 type VII secretion-associated serine protease [Couchioplanes caeruleus subsp. azureus]